MKINKAFISKLLLVMLILAANGFGPKKAFAATITSYSDTLTRLAQNVPANHEIFFVTPTGVASTQTVILTFTGFTSASVNAILFSDLDFASGSTNVCSSATYTEQTLVASGATSSQWNAAAATAAITFTSGGTSATVTANKCIRIRIGTNAVSGTTGVNQIANPVSAATAASIAVTGTFTDVGNLSVDIITNDQVTVTATVDPTITFAISQTSVTFGTLSSGTGRWATNGGGANAAAATDPTASNTAHTLIVSTNAASGYVITYNAPLLTSGGNTIAAATITGDSDGAPGTAQFALCGKATAGSPTVVSGYVCGTNSDYNFATSTTTTLASHNAPASSDTVSVAYLANISGSTPAGSYTSIVTYIATGTF